MGSGRQNLWSEWHLPTKNHCFEPPTDIGICFWLKEATWLTWGILTFTSMVLESDQLPNVISLQTQLGNSELELCSLKMLPQGEVDKYTCMETGVPSGQPRAACVGNPGGVSPVAESGVTTTAGACSGDFAKYRVAAANLRHVVH